ncbi:MAG: M48 family metallopeptidase [Actinomycetota bacterium]|nr:M48 family metallopeptidase [Actinomycetota bacterium]
MSANKRRSALLVAAVMALVLVMAWAVNLLFGFGVVGLGVALVVVGAGSAAAWWKSDAVALAMSHARPTTPESHPRLHNLVEGLCIAAGLPKPRIYVIEDPALNAFATGRNPAHAAVAVTTGLLEKLDRIELEGVLAHELSHVKNYDILYSTLAVTLVGVIALLADFSLRFLWWGGPRHRDDSRSGGAGPAAALAVFGFVLLLVTPIVARLMQFSVSRRREALADFSGVMLTRYPPGLIAALEKLQADTTVVHSSSRATAHLWMESPLARTAGEGRLAWLNRLFDTHPPLEERIQALKEL